MGIKVDIELDASNAARAAVGGIWGFVTSKYAGVAVTTTTTTVLAGGAGFAIAGPVGAALVGLGVTVGTVNAAVAMWATNPRHIDVHVTTDTEEEFTTI